MRAYRYLRTYLEGEAVKRARVTQQRAGVANDGALQRTSQQQVSRRLAYFGAVD